MKWHIDPTKIFLHNKLVYCISVGPDSWHREKYMLNGKFHSPNGPAYIRKYPNGHIESATYLVYGKMHRTDGPALIYYAISGDIEYESYWQNNYLLTVNG